MSVLGIWVRSIDFYRNNTAKGQVKGHAYILVNDLFLPIK